MYNRPRNSGRRSTALPTLVLAALAGALVLSATAVADPIITVPPIEAGGTQVSGNVGDDPQADVCVGDEHSGADPAQPSVVELNDSSCASGPGATTAGSGTSTTRSAGRRGGAATTVAAGDALGLRIAGVRKQLKGVTSRRNFRLFVTVRDARNLLVRGAIVSASRVPGSASTLSGLHAGFSNKRGVATILVPVTKKMFGKKLFVRIAARTPKARAVALRSVSLPRLR